MRANFIARVRILAGAVILVFLVLAFRLYDLQIVHGAEFKSRAEGQYAGDGGFDRGDIFFTDKNGATVGAATLSSGAGVALVPSEIDDPEAAYASLAEYLSIDHDSFIAKATEKDDPYEEVAHRVPGDVAQALREANITGIRIVPEAWRVYPDGSVAAHTIGFVGYGNGDRLKGQYGLERFYDDVLSQGGDGLSVNFFASLFTNIASTLFPAGGRAGGNVVTSIEPSVQSFIEGILDGYTEKWSPESAGAIVLSPSSGDIIAIAARPTYDPNDLKNSDASALANPLVERVYEFGSIMKPITIASGIDAGVITRYSTYTDRGYAVYDGSKIQNFDRKGRGTGVSMQEVLNQSLNTGAAYVAVEKLGPERFREYIARFGLMSPTGIDLPSEVGPLVSNLESPRQIEYATASFGQGFAVTPIAMARSLSALANYGALPTPRVAIAIEYPGEFGTNIQPLPGSQAVSRETAEEVTRMLVEVVDTALRGGAVRIPELSVAAKTGTAQIAQPGGGGYYTDRYLHSFFGYFPAYEPRFFVFFYAVEPQEARYASETWTTPFMDSVTFLMTYYGIAPDRATTE